MEPLGIIDRLAKEGPVILQAPISFLTAVVIVGGIIWLYFRRHHAERYAVMQQQIELHKTAREQAHKTKEALSSSGVFIIQQREHEFWWQDQRGAIHHLVGEKPEGARLTLQVMVRIFAPSILVEYVHLEIMGKPLQSDWESMKVDFLREQYVYIDFSSIRSGHYSVKLMAGTGGSFLGFSSPFEIEVPKFKYENA
jgi:hypothetical protein